MSVLRVNKIAAPIIEEEYTGSVHLDAGRDKLIVNGLADFDGQFTIEGWYLASAFETTPVYFGNWATSTGILLRGSTEITLFEGGDGNILQVSDANVNETGRWYHIAVTRDGSNTIRLFKDGVVIGSVVHSDTIDNQTNKFTIGAENGGTNGSDVWNGHISNFRIVQGNALYTDNFEVPTRELEVVDGTVVLCCQSSTSVTEEASGETTITIDTEGGNPTAQEANPGLLRKTNIYSTTTENTGSVFFDGTGDYLTISSNSDFAFGTSDFTIEMWVYSQSSGSFQTLIDFRPTATNGNYPALLRDTDGDLYYYVNSVRLIDNVSVSNNTWYHVAVCRNGSTTRFYLDGELQGSANDSTSYLTNDINISSYKSGGNYFNGYISNVRILKGKALYTSNFAVPTRELEVTPETVLVACHDGEDIFAEKTGKIIAAYGDRLSSPTPTATDSPIGITTFQPGLTRDVDPTAGPVLQGNLEYNSQNFLVLPKGTTEQRGGTRGVFGFGYPDTNTIDYVNIGSTGNAQDFGDLLEALQQGSTCSSSTRGIFMGGIAGANTNRIQFLTITSTGNTQDFGDLTQARHGCGGASNQTRGLCAGGVTPTVTNVIDYITIAATGNAQDFGDLTGARRNPNGCASPTRAIFAGGGPTAINNIDYVTIASTGNAADFGDLLTTNYLGNGCSNSIRGVFNIGSANTIEFITIATLGNAQDFGDRTASGSIPASTASPTRGLWAGGSPGINTIDYVQIMTTGNAADFGDLTRSNSSVGGLSNGHGGLG